MYDAKRRDWTSLEHWNLLTQGRHTTEVNLKNVSSELQEKFVVAHGSEWEAIWRCGAEWCQLQKLKYPDRVLSSRMVQRLKLQEGFGTPSRWCVQGHQDSDTEHLHVCARTPQSESILKFWLILVCQGHVLQIADFKHAFCQSHSLNRPLGPILVRSCSGPPLKPGELIQLLSLVYGLDDALDEWQKTVTTEYVSGLG